MTPPLVFINGVNCILQVTFFRHLTNFRFTFLTYVSTHKTCATAINAFSTLRTSTKCFHGCYNNVNMISFLCVFTTPSNVLLRSTFDMQELFDLHMNKNLDVCIP